MSDTQRNRAADGPRMTRRRLLQVGGIGAVGLTLPQLLRAGGPQRSEKSCIFIVQ
jgi:hypothetical protein